jgi:hypothetical protein
MNELGPDAKRLLEMARRGDEPASQDEARIQGALMRRIGATSLAVAASLEASKALAAGTVRVSLVKGAVIAAAVGASVAVAGWQAVQIVTEAVNSTPSAVSRASHAPPRADQAVAALTRPNSSAAPAAQPAVTSKPAVAAPRASDRRNPEPEASPPAPTGPAVAGFEPLPESTHSVSSPSNSLEAETSALREVQAALRAGQPSAALALIDQQNARFPAGSLAPERAASRVLALCALGFVERAQGEAARFALQWPNSPLLGRVRSACASP